MSFALRHVHRAFSGCRTSVESSRLQGTHIHRCCRGEFEKRSVAARS